MAATATKKEVGPQTNSRISSTRTEISVGGEGNPKPPSVIQDRIRELAYQKWEAAGKPASDGINFWLEAEKELQGKKK